MLKSLLGFCLLLAVIIYFHGNLFYLYIYPPDLQESIRGAINITSNYPNLLSKMIKYCCPVDFFFFFLVLLKYDQNLEPLAKTPNHGKVLFSKTQQNSASMS